MNFKPKVTERGGCHNDCPGGYGCKYKSDELLIYGRIGHQKPGPDCSSPGNEYGKNKVNPKALNERENLINGKATRKTTKNRSIDIDKG